MEVHTKMYEFFILLLFINVNLGIYQKMCYTSLKEKEVVWKLFTIKDKEELDKYVRKKY